MDVAVSSEEIVTLAEDLFLGVWSLGTGETSGSAIISNERQVNVEPIYSISGMRQMLEIVNQTTGKKIKFVNLDLVAGDELIIDTREQDRNAYIKRADGTIENALGFIVWSETDINLPLIPGNNMISFTSFGESDPLSVVILQQYLSA